MRERIRHMRAALVERLQAHGAKREFSFVLQQNGMFSYSGLTAEQVDRLREEFHIHAVNIGRFASPHSTAGTSTTSPRRSPPFCSDDASHIIRASILPR